MRLTRAVQSIGVTDLAPVVHHHAATIGSMIFAAFGVAVWAWAHRRPVVTVPSAFPRCLP